MKKITVIGAGYMGSAITYPLSDNNFDVSLCGTWLDDEIISSSKASIHPKLKKPINKNVKLFYWTEIDKALMDSEIIFIGVTSEGFIEIFKKILENIKKECTFLTLTKGFIKYKNKIYRISEIAETLFKDKFKNIIFKWCSIGGPVKAVELANFIPTVSIYGINNESLRNLAISFSTDYYEVFTISDFKGVEISSALKNIYSASIGIIDGLYINDNKDSYHNFSSWIFSQAIKEMAKISVVFGASEKTVFDFAGIGDLYVTSQSGRNRRLGELIGKGFKADEAYNLMLKEGEVAEGFNTLKLGFKWIKDKNKDLLIKLPLLQAIYSIITENKNPYYLLKSLFKKI